MKNIYFSCLSIANDYLQSQIKMGDYDKNYYACFFAIGTMIHWLVVTFEEFDIDGSFHSEFRFINNQLKHHPDIVKLQKAEGKLSFSEDGTPFGVINKDESITDLFCFPMELVWDEIDDCLVGDRYKNNNKSNKNYMQYTAYKDNLIGRNVFETLDKAYNDTKNMILCKP